MGTAEWLAKLQEKLLPFAQEFDLTAIDASILHGSKPRRLTQLMSRVAYDSTAEGIRYSSKFGHDLENWAFFEPVKIVTRRTEILKEDNPQLSEALKILKLKF